MPQLSEVERLQADWDRAAKENAFWYICTNFTDEEAFWRSGREEIRGLMRRLPKVERKRALDFGCGVGRVTQALAEFFELVDGVDVSSEMVRLADTYNRYEDRVWYHLNKHDHLNKWDDDMFDLVYSTIVLQHIRPHLQKAYVREFLRVARGLVVFQLPEGRNGLNAAHSMFSTPREVVEGWVCDAELVDVEENDAAGWGVKSYRYTVRP